MPLPRREFIRLAAAATAGMTVTHSVAGSVIGAASDVGAARSLRRPIRSGHPAQARIVVWLPGGLPHADLWDAKRHTPFVRGMPARELLATSPSIATRIDGVRFGSGVPHLAAVADRGCVLRAIVDDRNGAQPHLAAQRSVLRALLPDGAQRYVRVGLNPAVTGAATGAATEHDHDTLARALSHAARLTADGARSVHVELPFESFAGFDAHEDGARRSAVMARRIDRPIADLVLDLEARGMLDRTLVVVASEFGRTVSGLDDPAARLDDSAQYGFHEHFEACGAALLFGGGVRRGSVHGRTADRHPMTAVEDALSLDDLHATIAALTGTSGTPGTSGAVGRPAAALLA